MFGRKKAAKKKLDKKAIKSELAVKYNIRISTPGYYPDDVDKIIAGIENDYIEIASENAELARTLKDSQDEVQALKTELTKLRLDMALTPFDDLSDFDINTDDETVMIGLDEKALDETPPVKLNLQL